MINNKDKKDNKELLFSLGKKDFIIQTFHCGGHGGQNVNKLETGVRIIHKESEAIGESREERTQGQNKKIAFKKLTNSIKFKLWIKRRISEISEGITIEEKVKEDMKSENLKIETKDEDGNWKPIVFDNVSFTLHRKQRI